MALGPAQKVPLPAPWRVLGAPLGLPTMLELHASPPAGAALDATALAAAAMPAALSHGAC